MQKSGEMGLRPDFCISEPGKTRVCAWFLNAETGGNGRAPGFLHLGRLQEAFLPGFLHVERILSGFSPDFRTRASPSHPICRVFAGTEPSPPAREAGFRMTETSLADLFLAVGVR